MFLLSSSTIIALAHFILCMQQHLPLSYHLLMPTSTMVDLIWFHMYHVVGAAKSKQVGRPKFSASRLPLHLHGKSAGHKILPPGSLSLLQATPAVPFFLQCRAVESVPPGQMNFIPVRYLDCDNFIALATTLRWTQFAIHTGRSSLRSSIIVDPAFAYATMAMVGLHLPSTQDGLHL